MIEIESEIGVSASVHYPNGEQMNIYRLSNGNIDVMLSSNGLTYITVNDVSAGDFTVSLASLTEQAMQMGDSEGETYYHMLRDMFSSCLVAMKGVIA